MRKGAVNMVKITLDVEGMACGMCEAHVNDAISKAFVVKKVSSSFHKKKTEIFAESAISEEDLRRVVDATGYTVTGVHTEPYEKKGFSLFHRD